MLSRLKERLRPPRWLPIALEHPQSLVRVLLLADGRRVDVTQQNVVAALDPLTIALPASDELGSALDAAAPRLEFIDAGSDVALGRLTLQRARSLRLADRHAILFHVRSGSDYCEPWLPRALRRVANRALARRAPGPATGLQMSRAAIERLLVFYTCPRPVVLVSACEGSGGNLFPMDLLGPFGEGRFALALRRTSPSVETLQRSRTIVLSDISPGDCGTAYRLGAHHKTAMIDWNALPFPVQRTTRSDIPYPSIALRVRELALLDHAATGSHSFFVAEITADHVFSSGPRLFHTTSSHQRYRASRGTPLVSASPDER